MSLLIKALASAEKDKQAELGKGQKVGNPDSKMPLELTPVEVAKSEQLPPVDDTDIAKDSDSSLASGSVNASELSLEDEAGLALSAGAVKQHAKLKAGDNKAKQPSPQNAAVGSPNTKATPTSALATQFPPASTPNQKVVAKAFVANQQAKLTSSKPALAILGVAGALMIWLGLQGYQYIRDLTAPEVTLIKPAPAPAASNTEDTSIAVDSEASSSAALATTDRSEVGTELVEVAESQAANTGNAAEGESALKAAENSVPKQSLKNKQPVMVNDIGNGAELAQTQSLSQNTSMRTPLKLVSKTPDAGVDPILLAAYQAFNRGEDASAQQQYRQVLQHNVRNVDALLGMAAIAQRQGRDADAVGWYQKVLEIEPRNAIAQSAVVSLQVSNDVVGTESRIKSMLAQRPESANLHAALGNLYAAQSQWPLAQQAYFDASRFAPNNADYVFNLAISLDQLGKTKLALAQYQRALDLVKSSGTSTFDRAQLEARIQALQ